MREKVGLCSLLILEIPTDALKAFAPQDVLMAETAPPRLPAGVPSCYSQGKERALGPWKSELLADTVHRKKPSWEIYASKIHFPDLMLSKPPQFA